eukprot:TRINITY_DN11016_c0_g1_i1.p1 TRINITY_DN11016_c0_g1~~TRINITY_DN11016_c0_g1_i1.p1  ORF type:complete len:371 (-),score=94.80 TRINITY_DN11016_c0_g1_i1:90-1202(-)
MLSVFSYNFEISVDRTDDGFSIKLGVSFCDGVDRFPLGDTLGKSLKGDQVVYDCVELVGGVGESERMLRGVSKEKLGVEDVVVEPELVQVVKEGMHAGFKPTLISEGVGGAYFTYDSTGKIVAVFKPEDEEAGNENNPKNLAHRIIKEGVQPGEGAIREVAARMLDHERLAGVPDTHYTTLEVQEGVFKTGSLQEFVPNTGCCEDISSSFFKTEDVHRIAQLDMRLFNLDRTAENILYLKEKDGSYKLTPIDHSYSLPHKLSKPNFDWMYWKQAYEPFSKDLVEYIQNINLEKDAQALREIGISEDSIAVMKLSTSLLKHCSSLGWTPNKIADFMCRKYKGEDRRSDLEKLIEKAGNDYDTALELISSLQ